MPVGSQVVTEQQSLSNVSSVQPPLRPTAWMCCSRPARPAPPARRGEPTPPFVSRHSLFAACRVPNCSDSAAGGRHCWVCAAVAACAAVACPRAGCFCNPLKVAVPTLPRRSHCHSSGRGRVRTSAPALTPGQTKGTQDPGIAGPMVSSTSRTLGKGCSEVLGTA